MANYTDKLNLKKWDLNNADDLSSAFDIEGTLNENWDKVDEAIGTNIDNIATNTTNIETLQTSVDTNTENINTLQISVETNIEDIDTLEEQVATNTTNIETNATSITAIEEKDTEQDESITSLNTSVSTNTSSIEELQETVGTGFYSMIAKNAGAHNSVYRGEDITDLFYDGTLTTEIAKGTFNDIFIGDYIIGQSSSKKYLIADINYRLYKGDTVCTTPHVLLIPEQAFSNQKMNSTNTSEGAYVGSEMYTTNLEAVKEIIIADFESSHILTHRNYLANTLTDGYESSGDWYDSDIELMNESMVYGSNILHNIKNNTNLPDNKTIDTCQLSLFRLDKSKIISTNDGGVSRNSYWLRDVVSSTQFASVNQYGFANYSSANSSLNIRPAFLIY